MADPEDTVSSKSSVIPEDIVPSEVSGAHRLVWKGVFWNSLYQVFSTCLSFGAMLTLVRIIPPVEYGRWVTASGIVALINSFSAQHFIAQALQTPENEEPDWSQHWTAGFFLHVALTALCQVIALAAWFIPTFHSITFLLLLASVGLSIDWINHLGATMLRREMDFRSLRLVYAVGTLASTAVTVVLGIRGWGAYAFICGNLIVSLPYAVHLLFIRKWRPREGWFWWPKWSGYRPALHFGFQHAGSSLLLSARFGLESLVLPGTLGFPAMGLLNRAQALFSTTIGRVNNTLMETVYPLLPRSARDRQRFSRHATLVFQFIMVVSLPGALYLGLEGQALSRLVYGRKWIAVDPLIWPGAMLGLAVAVAAVFENILLAVNRLRTNFSLNVLGAVLALPALGVAFAGGGLEAYAWTLAFGQLIRAASSFGVVLPLMGRASVRQGLLPPVTSAAAATLALIVLRMYVSGIPLLWRVVATGSMFMFVFGLSLRFLFPAQLSEILHRVPKGDRIRGWLLLKRA